VGPVDIEDRIDRMLGRDGRQYAALLVAWAGLIEALARENVVMTAGELATLPLRVELEAPLAEELSRF
jgi:hypothetical protein